MDGDGDLVLLAELVEAVEAINRGIGAEVLQVQQLGELEDLLVGVVVLGEALHAPGNRRDIVFLADFQEGVGLLRLVGDGAVLLIELAIVKTQILGALEHLLQVEIAERIALHAEDEAAEGVVFLIISRFRKAASGCSCGTGLKKAAAGDVRLLIHEANSCEERIFAIKAWYW